MITCIASGCRSFGAHFPNCGDVECVGCQPRSAADGLRLCWPHRDRIEQDAKRAALVYDELEYVLVPPGQAQVLTSGTREIGLRLNPRAIASRTGIVAVLAAWSKLIAEERGIVPPAGEVSAMSAFVAAHATWLSAYPAADDCVDELRELAHGEPWRVAHPSGTRVEVFSDCPGLAGEGCPGMLRTIIRHRDAKRASEIVCDVDALHRWPVQEWVNLGVQLERLGIAVRRGDRVTA